MTSSIIFLFAVAVVVLGGSNSPDGMRDAAILRPAVQSSTYADKYALKAVDGNESTCSVAGIGSQSTSYGWWQVDLGAEYEVAFVRIKNTRDPYEFQYLSNFDVFVGSTNSVDVRTSNLCYSYERSSNPDEELLLQCSPSARGRHVTIKRFAGFRADALSICDFKAFVKKVPEDNSVQAADNEVPPTSVLIDLDPMMASQSWTYSTFEAKFAADRNKGTCSVAGVGSESTDLAWWSIDLGRAVHVTGVTLLNTGNYYESMFLNQFDVYVGTSGSRCASYDEKSPVPPSSNVTLNCPRGGIEGQQVSVKRFGGFRQDAISLCEVYIFGYIKENTYGSTPRNQELNKMKNVKPERWWSSSIFSIYSIDLAFDGDPSTCFIIGEGSNSLNLAWVVFDLGASYAVESVDILNHYNDYEASFLNRLEMSVDSNLKKEMASVERKICVLFEGQQVKKGERVTLKCPTGGALGRYLSLRKEGGGFRPDALAACEIEIFVFDTMPSNSSPETPISSSAAVTTTTRRTTTTTTTTTATSPTTSTRTAATTFTTTTTTTKVSTTRPTMACPKGFLKCSRGDSCYLEENRCDGWHDCHDLSDEENCDCERLGRFRCKNSRCIDLAWSCDREDDCGDASDETNCNCSVAEFKCGNGKCVKLSEKCNGWDNCGDGSDEFQCGICSPTDFKCDRKCISHLDVCNKQFDCIDGTDEMNCDCAGGSYRCAPTGICVFKDQICDGIRHCPDNSDEMNCTCLESQYKCRDGPCISEHWLCDGNKDCPQADDEDACQKCREDQFACRKNGWCLERSRVCDGIFDCPDLDDEQKCLRLEEDGNSSSSSSSPSEDALKLIHKGEEYSICKDRWNQNFSLLACFYLGLGYPQAASSTNISTPGKFATLKIDEPNLTGAMFTDWFSFGAGCSSNSAVTLKCTPSFDCGSRSSVNSKMAANLVNGDLAAKGDWPWLVQIFVEGLFTCGGTLVQRQWVITAAHCVYSIKYDTIPKSSITIVMGSDVVDGASNPLNSSNVQLSGVDKIAIHPRYNDQYNNYDYALLRLSSPVTWTDLVRPACLPIGGSEVPRFKSCYATGYGMTYPDSPYSKFLLQARMDILEYEVCVDQVLATTNYSRTHVESSLSRRTMFCAGSYPTAFSSTCRGDSGSPLMCQDENNRWLVVGLSSFSFETDLNKCKNSFFANVSAALDWIENLMMT